jgi:hypothetical protein
MRFDLIPHVGTNGLTFGMTREAVRNLLGAPFSAQEKSVFNSHGFSIPTPARDGYFENELQVHYDDDHRTNFIELYGRGAKHVSVFLDGLDLFAIPAHALLLEIIKNRSVRFDENDAEIPYCYTFPDIDLAFWRQVSPEVNEETEAVPEGDDGKYFWTVAIGAKGYYKATDNTDVHR